MAYILRTGNAIVVILLAVYFLVLPGLVVWRDLGDPGLRNGGIPRCAFRWHRVLSPRYQRWALDRIASGQATALETTDISGTEWPLFGSAFYLWAT
jgi:hypothetical protein